MIKKFVLSHMMLKVVKFLSKDKDKLFIKIIYKTKNLSNIFFSKRFYNIWICFCIYPIPIFIY